MFFSHTLQTCYSHVTSEVRQLRWDLNAGRPWKQRENHLFSRSHSRNLCCSCPHHPAHPASRTPCTQSILHNTEKLTCEPPSLTTCQLQALLEYGRRMHIVFFLANRHPAPASQNSRQPLCSSLGYMHIQTLLCRSTPRKEQHHLTDPFTTSFSSSSFIIFQWL